MRFWEITSYHASNVSDWTVCPEKVNELPDFSMAVLGDGGLGGPEARAGQALVLKMIWCRARHPARCSLCSLWRALAAWKVIPEPAW